MLHSLRTLPLHDAIQQQLKQYILQRGLRPGDRLPTEEQLAREVGVSRNAVREALRALESIGLVEARRGAGRFVRQFSFDTILDHLGYAIYFDNHSFDELLEVRGELEIAFIGRAVPLLTADDLAAIHAIARSMQQKARAGQPYLPEDTAFHARIFARLGNQLLLRLLDVFWRLSEALQQSGDLLQPAPASLLEVCQTHIEIAQALDRRDAEAATFWMRYHFDYARRELVERLIGYSNRRRIGVNDMASDRWHSER
ncbi:MAG: FadR family transcriptional regulator [Chloroflexi bacterium]|nr:FadR family transcriptional regulator [Chloroflexota bacterium]